MTDLADKSDKNVPYEVLKAGMKCPKCATNLSGHIASDGAARPSQGDATICFYCASVLMYNHTTFGWHFTMMPESQWSQEVREMQLKAQVYRKQGIGPSALGVDVSQRDGQRG